MATEKDPLKPGKKEPEYQFKGDEFANEPEEKSSGGGFKSALFNRRVVVPIILIIAVFAVYQFLSKEEPQVKEEIKQVTSEVIHPAIQPTQPTPIVAVTETPVVATDTLNSLAQQSQQHQNQIQQLQGGMQQLHVSVAQVGQQVSALNSSVTNLAQTCKAPTPPVVVRTVVRQKPLVIRTIYHVRAVVPGRAWLHGSNGSLQTVKVGDFLPGYGTVQMIDPTQGKVLTSWGTVIRYGKNDS